MSFLNCERGVSGAVRGLVLLLGVACSDSNAPSTGAVHVTVTTTGAELDPDSYTAAIDDRAGQAIPINGAITFSGVSAGSHRVLLTGLAPNCATGGEPNPRPVAVLAGVTAQVAFSVTCAAPSGRIVFQSTRPGGTPDLLVMDPDGSNVQTLLGGAATDQSPAASPDGSRIAFSSNREGDFDLYVINRDGSGLAHITGPSTRDTTYDDSPSWSPDGSKLVFARSLPLGAVLMVVNVDGTGETALTSVVTSGYLDSPAWSPNGTKIAYTGGGSPRVFVMNADGSGAAPLPTLSSDTVDHAAWSPDGTRLAVHDLSHGIIVMNADGSDPVILLPGGEYGTEPAWSPDGAYLVFTKIFPGNRRIARIKADGSGEVELTSGVGAVDGHPTWSR